MVEQIPERQEDLKFQDKKGTIFHSDYHGVDMRSTHPSIIEGVQNEDAKAQERFMRRYFEPCYCYYEAGHWGFDSRTAEELTRAYPKTPIIGLFSAINGVF